MRKIRFSQRPAVVIVEDTPWADDASLGIIRHLARRIEPLPAMLVVSYRSGELADDHPFRRIIGALAGPAVLHLELDGLSDATLARLAADAGLAPGPVVAAVGQPLLPRRGPGRSRPGGPAVGAPRRLGPGAVAGRGPAARPGGAGAGRAARDPGRLPARDPVPARAGQAGGRALAPVRARIDHHRRVLEALVAAGAEPSRLYHAVAAADDQAVARYAAAAATEAARAEGTVRPPPSPGWRWSGAGGWTGSSWSGCTGWPPGPCTRSNRFGEATGHSDRAVKIWDADGSTPLELGEALLIPARMRTLRADPDAARAKALRALDVLESRSGPATPWPCAYSTLCAQDVLQARFRRASGRRRPGRDGRWSWPRGSAPPTWSPRAGIPRAGQGVGG